MTQRPTTPVVKWPTTPDVLLRVWDELGYDIRRPAAGGKIGYF